MAYAGKGGVESSAKRPIKLSRERKTEGDSSESSAKSGEYSKLPKVKHRERKAAWALDKAQKKTLMGEVDKLCRPTEDREERVAKWVALSRIKVEKSWLKEHAEAFEDMERFKPSQFLLTLSAQKYDANTAIHYTDALIVSQTAFSSVASYNAAYETVKLVAKGVCSTQEELLDELRKIGEKGVNVKSLQTAASDVGNKSPALRNLLILAVDLQEPYLDESDRATGLQTLKQALARLGKAPRSANPIRSSAPTGTISFDSLKKQAKTVSMPQVATQSIERKHSHEGAGAETPPASQRSEIQREEQSAGKSKPKTISKTKSGTSDSTPERASASKREKFGKTETKREVSGNKERKEERKTEEGQSQPAHPITAAEGDASSGASVSSTPGTPRTTPAPQPRPQGMGPGSQATTQAGSETGTKGKYGFALPGLTPKPAEQKKPAEQS